LQLTFFGHGPDGSRLQRRASTLGIGDRVSFAGHLPRTDLPYLSGADLSHLLARPDFGEHVADHRAAADSADALRASVSIVAQPARSAASDAAATSLSLISDLPPFGLGLQLRMHARGLLFGLGWGFRKKPHDCVAALSAGHCKGLAREVPALLHRPGGAAVSVREGGGRARPQMQQARGTDVEAGCGAGAERQSQWM
jgi:hypothetical protein